MVFMFTDLFSRLFALTCMDALIQRSHGCEGAVIRVHLRFLFFFGEWVL